MSVQSVHFEITRTTGTESFDDDWGRFDAALSDPILQKVVITTTVDEVLPTVDEVDPDLAAALQEGAPQIDAGVQLEEEDEELERLIAEEEAEDARKAAKKNA